MWQQISSLAAAKIGLKVFDMDVDTINTVEDVRACLAAADSRMIVFDPEDDRLELLRKAIPEFYHCEKYTSSIYMTKFIVLVNSET